MLLAQVTQQIPEFPDLPGIQSHSRLVQDQDLRLAYQQLRHSHSLAVAFGQVPDQAVPGVQDLRACAEFVDICPHFGLLHPQTPKFTSEFQLLCHCHVHIQRGDLRQVTDMPLGFQRVLCHIHTGDPDLAPRGGQITAEQIHRGGFPSSVGAEKSHDLTFFNRKVRIKQCFGSTILFCQMDRFNHHMCPPLRTAQSEKYEG